MSPSERSPSPPDRLTELLQEVRTFVAERSWEPYHDPKNLAMCIASEAGELLSELRWIEGKDADAHCASPEHRQAVVDELADITLAVLMFADRIDVDLPEAVLAKLERIRAKYPVEGELG